MWCRYISCVCVCGFLYVKVEVQSENGTECHETRTNINYRVSAHETGGTYIDIDHMGNQVNVKVFSIIKWVT